MMNTFVMVETYSQEIGLELDGPGQVWQGGFGFSHCQEDGGSLVEGQVVLGISLCAAQKVVILTLLTLGVKMDDLSAQRRKCQCVCRLTHSGVVVRQGLSQLPSSQEFAAHLQMVLDLSLGGPQDP